MKDCPTTLDYLANYRDGVDKLEYVLGAPTANGADSRPIVYYPSATDAEPSTSTAVKGTRTQQRISYPNTVLSFDQNRLAGSSHNHKPRGTWAISRIYVKDAAVTDGGNARHQGASCWR